MGDRPWCDCGRVRNAWYRRSWWQRLWGLPKPPPVVPYADVPDVPDVPTWPTRPGMEPRSVSHDKRCPWTGECHPDCRAPDRRRRPLWAR